MSRVSSPPIGTSVTAVLRSSEPLTLHLEAEPISPDAPERPQVRWTEDVIDNEHMNKKKSKVCCIFHKQRVFGESSSESSSSSSSESDSDFGGFGSDADGDSVPKRTAPVAKKKKKVHEHKEGSDDEKCCDHNHDHSHAQQGSEPESDTDEGAESDAVKRRQARLLRQQRRRKAARAASPNAYERQPKYRPKTSQPAIPTSGP